MAGNSDYDIGKAFQAIENELISSIIRNMERHKAEETKEGYEWEMWQAKQLDSLEKYKKDNRKKYGKKFRDINKKIEAVIRGANEDGQMDQETSILNAIKDGYPGIRKTPSGGSGTFFKVNDRKLDSLIKATTDDMKKAETAILRQANDGYRKAIYNAQVYANTGAGTYEKAVDMATKDMLAAGLNCIKYKNGSRHTLADYADMALRTASKRAYLQGEGTKRQEWQIYTVIVNKRGNPCPKCLPFCGKVFIDDVWSGGPKDGKSPLTGQTYPLMSSAVEAGLYHPRCKDSHTTYFEGISSPPDGKYSKKEIEQIEKENRQEAKKQYVKRQMEKYDRLTMYSLDEENQKKYAARRDTWKRVRFKTGELSTKEYAQSKRPLGNFRAVPQDQVVNVLRKDSEEWISTLTANEENAIRKYTYNPGDEKPNRFFERLNTILRSRGSENEVHDTLLENYAQTISTAIKKNTLKRDVVCYRSIDLNVYETKEVGNVFKEKQFISTSVVKKGALDKKYKITIYVKKGSSAAYVESISEFPNQRELLLDKDTVFRVLSKKDNTIELEVI